MTELNIGLDTVVKYLESVPGLEPGKELSPNTKLSNEQYEALKKRFLGDKRIKEKADSIFLLTSREQKPSIHITDGKGIDVKVVGKIDLDSINQKTRPKKKSKEERKAERQAKRTREREINETNNPITPKGEGEEVTISREQLTQKHIINLSQLTYDRDRIIYTTGGDTFIFIYDGMRSYLNLYRDNSLLENTYTKIIVDYKNHTFHFEDYSIFGTIQKFIGVVDDDMKRKQKELDSRKDIKANIVKNEKEPSHAIVQEKETIQEKSESTDKHVKKTCIITFSQLRFEEGYITYRTGNDTFVFRHYGFSSYLNKYKNDPRIKGVSTQIIVDYSNGYFSFVDSKALQTLEDFKAMIDNEAFENHLKDVERKKEKEERNKAKQEKKTKPKIEHRIQFNAIRFGRSLASIIYKKQRYVYRDYNIKEYDRILGQVYSRVSKARMNAIKTSLIWVIIDTETGTFSFKDIDINKYVNNLKDNFLPESKKVENRIEKKIVPQKPSSATKTMTLCAGNIHFYNDYFLIFQTANGQIDNSVAPYRVNDPDSHEILNLVHNYFEQRFEQMRIVVKHDGTKILEPSRLDIFQLKNYVRALRRNLEVKGEWWEEVQNARKRSFAQCFGESRDSVKSKYVKSKNEYLYNLSSLQNEKKLIRVYEINHGKEEDAFIFTIDMSGNRNAIIFENASNDASTTTWVFVAKNENYEACVNLIFDYFTDFTISSKRSSLRAKDVNPPEKFKADSYAFIDHDDLEQWLKKLNRILENKPQPSEIRFVPGLNIPQSSETRTPSGNAITTSNLHNQLMLKLYDKLCSESGKENVGTEIRVGTKRIDAVVKGKGFYDIYEVKTASNSFDCVTEALGQICQYAYLYCRDNIGKMVIVGAPAASSEVEQYLSWFRKKHSMEVYYMKI